MRYSSQFKVDKYVFIRDYKRVEKYMIEKYQLNAAQGEWVTTENCQSLYKEFEQIGN